MIIFLSIKFIYYQCVSKYRNITISSTFYYSSKQYAETFLFFPLLVYQIHFEIYTDVRQHYCEGNVISKEMSFSVCGKIKANALFSECTRRLTRKIAQSLRDTFRFKGRDSILFLLWKSLSCFQ